MFLLCGQQNVFFLNFFLNKIQKEEQIMMKVLRFSQIHPDPPIQNKIVVATGAVGIILVVFAPGRRGLTFFLKRRTYNDRFETRRRTS